MSVTILYYICWPTTRAAFTGIRITLRQVSPESESIFDFIVELYKSSNDDWKALAEKASISDQDLQHFLEYATQFLGTYLNGFTPTWCFMSSLLVLSLFWDVQENTF